VRRSTTICYSADVRLIRTALALLLAPAPCAVPQTVSAGGLSREMLTAHNRVRSRVAVPPLAWSGEIAAVAQQWADHLLTTGRFVHRPKAQYGENLYEVRGTAGGATPAQVVAGWAGEVKDYDAARNTCRAGAMCGHYTQLVWRDTKQVGCAVARQRTREVWVCNYGPPGNWIGERPY
jgi:pathogenesis-related protein 1